MKSQADRILTTSETSSSGHAALETTTLISLNELMTKLVSLTVVANRIINGVHATRDTVPLDIINKGRNDPQTRADRETEHFLIQGIRERFPGIPIVGEESSHQHSEILVKDASAQSHQELLAASPVPGTLRLPFTAATDIVRPMREFCLWLDPLDGTREFRDGKMEFVTVLVGVSLNNRPIAGIISVPLEETLFCGIVGAGAFQMETRAPFAIQATFPPPSPSIPVPLSSSSSSPLLPAPLSLKTIITSQSRSNTVSKFVEEARRRAQGRTLEVVTAGGAGHKMLQVFLRRADLYPFTAAGGLSYWDVCACDALLESVGGRVVSSPLGKRLVYDPSSSSFDVPSGIMASHDEDIIAFAVSVVRSSSL